MDELLKTITLSLASAAEGAASIIIAFAVIEALITAAVLFVPRSWRNSERHQLAEKEDVRLRLGRWLAVALEFLLAADILRTAVAPTWNDIGKLAAIAALRTLLNYFLQREIDRANQRTAGQAPPAPAP